MVLVAAQDWRAVRVLMVALVVLTQRITPHQADLVALDLAMVRTESRLQMLRLCLRLDVFCPELAVVVVVDLMLVPVAMVALVAMRISALETPPAASVARAPLAVAAVAWHSQMPSTRQCLHPPFRMAVLVGLRQQLVKRQRKRDLVVVAADRA